MPPLYRLAQITDIPQIMSIRLAVKENQLTDPASITAADCQYFLENKGNGWVCQMDQRVVGFSMLDTQAHQIWALFIDPSFEGQGIGRALQGILLDWHFEQSRQPIWLSTSPGTRAEQFYRRSGWREVGIYNEDEIKFELDYATWFKTK